MKNKVVYINYIYNGERETVDEFPCNTREEIKEARRCLNEYRMSSEGSYYLSQRCCKNWK